ALLAEQSFIKRYRPRFNIRLRDDKSYPYVGVSLDEEFPRVYFTRERHRPNRAYFGPFSSAKRVRETLDLLGKLFQYRTCEGAERIGVAVEGDDATAQVFQVRDGVLAERQGFYLAGGDGEADGDRDPGEVAETFLLQYYGAAPAVPGRVIVGPELRGRTGVLA